MFDDDTNASPNRPATRLLDELESIKGTLSDRGRADGGSSQDIPLLDDMVIHNLNDNAKLLNIGQIFDDSSADDEPAAAVEPPIHFPRFKLDVTISDTDVPEDKRANTPVATTSAVKPRVRPDYSREVLIQELVDEFIPQIEAELHRRLQQIDDVALRRLKDAE
ncbi:MAG TPA: hypothetical protein VFM32_01875 [Spongiibacteraceae bacterium]|nr:hypothetical protein [Spongiibacteraceae bacterium]